MMWTALLNFISGGLFGRFLDYRRQVERDRLDAMHSSERLAYQDRQEERAARLSIRKATAGFIEMRVLTVLIALPFIEHLFAVWADTRWGWYSRGGIFEHCWLENGRELCGVPAFPDPFNEWQAAILLSFFGITAVSGGVRAIAGAIALKRKSK